MEFGIDMSTLLYLKLIPSKGILYSTWNSAQLCGSLDDRESGGDWVHVYVWWSPFAVHLNPLKHC